MDDRDIVAAIAAGDPAGLAGAYDEYAESLYGYCRWMLSEPEDAADAVEDSYVIAAGRLGGLRDPRRLRPWLYAVARNECYLRRGTPGAGIDGGAGPVPPPGGPADGNRAELRRLVRAALAGLNPAEREVLELSLRHDLEGGDLAAVLGVPRNRAHTLASRALGRIEKALGALLVARSGRRGCPELDMLLGDGEGPLSSLSRRRAKRHIGRCDTCADRRHSALRPGVLFGMAPLAALPPGLRGEVLGLCADTSPEARSYRRDMAEQAGPFQPNGFPEAIRPPRRPMLALTRAAAAAGVVIAVAATGIVTVLALTGGHRAPPAAGSGSGGTGSAGASVTASTGPPGVPSPSLSPTMSVPAVTAAPAPVAASPSASPTASPSGAKPSPSRPATSSAPTPPTLPPISPFAPATPTPTATATSTATSTQ